jgi:hypothetical protein
MRRFFYLLLALGLLAPFAGGDSHAFTAKARQQAALGLYDLDRVAEDGKNRQALRVDRENLSEKKERRGVGAGFWGGPYWGYGPRWGHRCETCRSACEEDGDEARCQRCRIRCGW